MTAPGTALTMIVTDAGRAALVDAAAGGTTSVTITEAGFSAATFVAAPTLTALPGEFKRVATVAGEAADDTTVHLVIRDGSADAYTVRAIGLYLADGTLFAVYGQADPILGKAEVSTFLLAADLKFLPGEAALVTFGDTSFLNPPATEETKGVAYLATLAEALAGAVADKIITPGTLAAVLANYVQTAQRGVANGVAELGADGKLKISQRPAIDLIDVWPVANQAAMLALATATVGDFAVRADNGLIYVLQALPAATLGNWLEIATPAPVSSVNAKVGSVVLDAGDVGAVPVARTVSGGGLVSGGGDLGANRTLTVTPASSAEALAAIVNTKVLTPASLAGLLALLATKVEGGVTVTGSGLVSGGGPISGNPVLAVIAANLAALTAGGGTSAITPATLAALPKSLTPNGYITLPLPDEAGNYPIIQWIRHRALYLDETSFALSWPFVYPNDCFVAPATGWINTPSGNRNMYPQTTTVSRFGLVIQLQRDDPDNHQLNGVDIMSIGF